MQPTLDYFRQAETVIREVLMTVRPRLLAAYGKAEYTLKKDHSIVTELDTMVEDRLRSALNTFDSSVGFGGEESGVDYNQKTFWLADPIDGTEQLIRGMPGCTNMLTLIDNDRPVASIIYDFVRDEWYSAFLGHGAACNGVPVYVSNRPMSRAWVDFACPLRTPEGIAMRLRLDKTCKVIHTIEASRLVASGKIEGYVAYNGRGGPWDYAPRVLLAQAAGAHVTNLSGGKYDYRSANFIATNPIIYDAILATIRAA